MAAWAACWTLPRSRPSRQLGEQGGVGRVLSLVPCPCPPRSSSCSSMVPSVPPPQPLLFPPSPVRGTHPCASPVHISVLYLALLYLSETEGSFSDLKYQGFCSLCPCRCWQRELGTHRRPKLAMNAFTALLEAPCPGVPALSLSHLT